MSIVDKKLFRYGAAFHWLHEGTKRPIGNDWSTAPRASWAELQKTYRKGYNVGIRLGKWSETDDGYIHVLDVDARASGAIEAAWEMLDDLFPGVDLRSFPTVKSGSGGDSFHIYFIADRPFASRKLAHSTESFVDDFGKKHWEWEIELFGTGKQVACPPSIHPDTGNEYEWVEPFDTLAKPPLIDGDLIADLLHDEDDGRPTNADICDISYRDAEDYLAYLDLDYWCEDREGWRNVGMALHHEFGGAEEAFRIWSKFSKQSEKFDPKVQRQQWRSFKVTAEKPIRMATIIKAAREAQHSMLQESITDELDDLPEEESSSGERGRQERKRRLSDPDMSILRQSRVTAPQFPLDIFKKAAPKIAVAARSAGSPVDFLAGAILCGASACIGNSTRVQIKPGFIQTPILWAQIIGLPSANKSPALRIVTKVMRKIEKQHEPIYEQAYRRWLRSKAIAEANLKEWEAKIRAMAAEGKEVSDNEPEGCRIPPEPNRRQTILNDLTIEAFMRAQARNPRGFMVYRDELAGWLGNMERYSAESERGAWLESYDGGEYSIERVKEGRKTIRVDHLCAPIMGGIQPERLLTITATNAVDDGLQARFMPFWPEPEYIPMSDGAEDDDWLYYALEALANLPMDTDAQGRPMPYLVKFNDEAFRCFREWSDGRKRLESRVNSRLAGVFGKAEGQVGRIALVLEYFWWALGQTGFDDEAPPTMVGVEAVKAAIRLREEYLKHMQMRVFSHAIELREVTNARLIANWIVNENCDVFNASKVRREAGIKGLSGRTSAEDFDAAIAVLVNLQWLTKETKSGRGRPKKQYRVSDRIWDLLECE